MQVVVREQGASEALPIGGCRSRAKKAATSICADDDDDGVPLCRNASLPSSAMDALSRKAQGKLSKFLKKFDGGADDVDAVIGGDSESEFTGKISEHDVYRYRKQRGVNLGELFPSCKPRFLNV